MQNTEEVLMKVGMDLASINAKTSELLQRQEKAAGSIKSIWKEVGAMFGGAAILSGMNKVIDKFDELQDRADNLGTSTDFLQGMGGVASKNAVGGVETFNKAITELSNKLGDAKDGGEQSIKMFQKYGITLQQIQDLDAEKMFYLISDRIKGIDDPAKRTAAAFDLLGKSGKNLTGVLSVGASELKKMGDAIDKLDASKVKSLADAKDQIEDFRNTAIVVGGKFLGLFADYGTFMGKYWSNADTIAKAAAEEEFRRIEKEKKARLDSRKAELEAVKKVAEEAKKMRLDSVQKITTERTEILKKLHEGEKYATPEAIAGRDAMARLKKLYGEGGERDLGAGKSRLAGVAAQLEEAKMDEEYARGMGWTERANADRMKADKMQGILEKYGAAKPSERISDVVAKLVDVDKKLANLSVTIKGVE